MSETGKPERILQFSLRKALLWVAVVALAFGVLSSSLDMTLVGWALLCGLVSAVLAVRWAFGSIWAAAVSAVIGMLPVTTLFWQMWRGEGRGTIYEAIAVIISGVIVGGSVGLAVFLLTEGLCRIINWLDKIGHANG